MKGLQKSYVYAASFFDRWVRLHRTYIVSTTWTTTSMCAKHLSIRKPKVCSWWGSLIISWCYKYILVLWLTRLNHWTSQIHWNHTEIISPIIITKKCWQSDTPCYKTTQPSLQNMISYELTSLETSMRSIQTSWD